MLFLGLALGWQLKGLLHTSGREEATIHSIPLQEPVDLRTYQSRQAELKAEPEVIDQFVDDIDKVLLKGDYAKAVALYNQRQRAGSEQEAERHRLAILNHVISLLESGSNDQALTLLNSYLVSEFNDVDALRLKARALAALKDYEQQIDVLYEAKSYAYQQSVITEIERALRASVDSYRQRLFENRQYAALLALLQRLVYLEPEYSVYFIELAKAQRLNHLQLQARQSLELVMYDPDVGGQAQRMLEELNVTDQSVEQRVATIDELQGAPLIRRGNHFVVEATLNGSERLKLIIDTGASLTIIKPERLRSSINENLDHHPTYRFSTANGVVKAPVLKVSSLAIAEFEVTNMEVGGLALINTEGVDGLLGMNFLKHFRFFIDQQNNVLRLALNQEQ